MRDFNGFDRFVVILDRTLVILACAFFLWVQSVQRDFLPLLLGIGCVIGWIFTSRYHLKHFREGDAEQPENRKPLK